MRNGAQTRKRGPKLARPRATIRPLDRTDPRSIDHPDHRKTWLELADAIGRLEAREIIRLRRQGKINEGS